MKKRLTALLLAVIMILSPALALAEQIDIDNGSLTIYTDTYSQPDAGHDNTPYSGSAEVISTTGTTSNTVTFDTSQGAVDATVSNISFSGIPANEAAISIVGDGTANVALDNVEVTGDNTALSIEHGSGGIGPTANLDMTGVDIDIDGPAAAIRVHNSTVNIDVNGANLVEADGIALSMYNSNATVAGDNTGDALNLTSASNQGTVNGDGGSTITATGEAVLYIVNTGGHEPVQGVTVINNTGDSTGGTGGDTGGSTVGTGTVVRIKIPTVEELKAMGYKELRTLSGEVIQALTKAHIEVLSADQISWLTDQQIMALTARQIGWLTEEQIQALSTDQIKRLNKSQIQALTEKQIRLLTERQLHAIPKMMKNLTEEQISYLTLEQMTYLKPEHISGMDEDKMMMLSAEQVQALSREQVQALSSGQMDNLWGDEIIIGQLSAEQMSYLTPKQISWLKTSRIPLLPTEHIKALSPDHIPALTKVQIRVLRPEQLGWMSPEQLSGLTLEQLGWLSEEQVAALSPEQHAALQPPEIQKGEISKPD